MWGLVCEAFAECTRGGVRVLERSSHGGAAFLRSTLMLLRGGPSVLRWVHGVCLGALALVAGLFGGSLDGVEGSTRWCRTGSLLSPCAILSRRVLFFWWLAACCGFALRYDVGGALSA